MPSIRTYQSSSGDSSVIMVMSSRTLKSFAPAALLFSILRATSALPEFPTIATGNVILHAQDTDHACYYAYRVENERINLANGLANSLVSIAESTHARQYDSRYQSAEFDCHETRNIMPPMEAIVNRRNAGKWYMECNGNTQIVPVQRYTTVEDAPRTAAICVEPSVKESMLISAGQTDCKQVAYSPGQSSDSPWASIIGYLSAEEEEMAVQAALLSILEGGTIIGWAKDVSTLEVPHVNTKKTYRVCAHARPGHGNVRLHAGFVSA